MAKAPPPPYTLMVAVALRDGLSISEVDALIQHWCAPAMWEYGSFLTLAFADAPAWQAWRAHHAELLQLGYYRGDRI